MKHLLLLLCCAGLFALQVRAQDPQEVFLTGTVVEAGENSPLPGVNVVLTSLADTTRQTGVISETDGRFLFRIPEPGAYRLRLSFVGFKPVERTVQMADSSLNLGRIALEQDVLQLDQVVVEDTQDRVEVRGDTTIYNADAFKVNPDADAEDLVAKLPGLVVQDGEVQAQGETVRRVLVDGREFFGEDPTLALRNLPAEIIDKIEVFDKLSDQAEFTGFNDGNTEKTINIITRPGMQVGQFGKIFGGYGTEDRYQGGGSVNFFNGDQRISLIGLANNVNQQNFATEDLLGVIGTAGGRRGGGGSRQGGGRLGGTGGGRGGMGGGPGGVGGGMRSGMGGLSTNPSDFLIGQQPGTSATNALGVNYTDTWGTKLRVTGSYFFNNSANVTDALLDREYILADAESQLYEETNYAESDNFNHRFNLRLQYDIDEANSLIITPRLSFQNNNSTSLLEGTSAAAAGGLLSQTTSDYAGENAGYTSQTNILFRHRFPKRGRTLSAGVGIGLNDRWGDTDQFSENVFYDPLGSTTVPDSSLVYDQQIDSDQGGTSLTTNLAYTEPVGERGQLMITYRPAVAWNVSDREALQFDPLTGTYSIPDAAFSSRFDNTVVTQQGGVSYRRRGQKSMVMLGVNVQDERLTGDQTFPTAFEVDRSFQSVLPMAMFQYRFSPSNNLRLFYRTSTDTPSISELQDVVDNTNPLQLSTGNPDLRPSYAHTALARYNVTDAANGRVFMGFLSVSRTDDYIGGTSFIAETDTLIQPNVLLLQGAQFARPENLDGYWNARSFFTYGQPVAWLKSNLNLNAGLSYARTPSLINDQYNLSKVTGLNGGVVVGSNISEQVDFTLSYSANYNIVENTIYPELDSDYLLHASSVRFNWLPWEHLVLDSKLTYSQYSGLGEGFDQQTIRWDAGIGYKFLKGNAAEVKLLVADILNQDDNITRTVTETYIEDNQTETLGRYVMLNLTYRLRNFNI